MLSEGQQPYTPTRVEWLAQVLSAKYQFLSFSRINIIYIAVPEKDTLRIVVTYPKNVEENKANGIMELAKRAALETAKKYQWDSWLKIEGYVEKSKEYHTD